MCDNLLGLLINKKANTLKMTNQSKIKWKNNKLKFKIQIKESFNFQNLAEKNENLRVATCY